MELSLGGSGSDGPPLLDLRVTVDDRTNSLVIAGSPSNVAIIEGLVYRLDEEQAPEKRRRQDVFHLRNASATDVANSLTTFFTNEITVLRNAGELPTTIDFNREVVIVPEPITNKLLISTSEQTFETVMHLIHELDADVPQVVIQCLVAEVDLTGSEEFGVEIGLQTPVVFNRSLFPASGFAGTSTVSYANATGGVIPPGVTVSGTQNPTSLTGFNFGGSNTSLANNVNPAVSPSLVGYQGLGALGVGRVSPVSGVGGFVFSAASDSFNLLIRALKQQGRVDILSRPQITTLDNQSASILVGQSVPYITGSNVTATGIITNSVTYRDVGIQLQVVPRITPDGRVLMRVVPEISSVAPTQIPIGNGTTATAFNVQNLSTTVIAQDGETVALGGLIAKRDEKAENKIPVLGDLPFGIGAAFRYRTQYKNKTELMVILTPHIVRNKAEANRMLAEEAQRMDWILGDVMRFHGTTNIEPILPHPVGSGLHGGSGAACDAPQEGLISGLPTTDLAPPGYSPSPILVPPTAPYMVPQGSAPVYQPRSADQLPPPGVNSQSSVTPKAPTTASTAQSPFTYQTPAPQAQPVAAPPGTDNAANTTAQVPAQTPPSVPVHINPAQPPIYSGVTAPAARP